MDPDLEAICREFEMVGGFCGAERWGSGLINDSYAVDFADRDGRRRYLLQQLNHKVFPDPAAVMENIRRVTEHLGGEADSRRALSLIPTRSGEVFHRDASGNTWRAFPFIERTRTWNVVPTASVAKAGARAFGIFQRRLRDLPGPRLTEILPGFHHTPTRFAEFLDARREDPLERIREVRAEIEFALDREEITGVLEAARVAGKMPERVTHNDTKINNVLFDEETGEGICVIDLDTVMPGLALYDFGDLVRTSVSPAAQDERDLERVTFRPEIYEALVEGYTKGVGDLLTTTEHELLFFSGRLITFEIGLRFLADFLRGDTYFRTVRERQNLDRARVQFELVKKLEACAPGA